MILPLTCSKLSHAKLQTFHLCSMWVENVWKKWLDREEGRALQQFSLWLCQKVLKITIRGQRILIIKIHTRFFSGCWEKWKLLCCSFGIFHCLHIHVENHENEGNRRQEALLFSLNIIIHARLFWKSYKRKLERQKNSLFSNMGKEYPCSFYCRCCRASENTKALP